MHQRLPRCYPSGASWAAWGAACWQTSCRGWAPPPGSPAVRLGSCSGCFVLAPACACLNLLVWTPRCDCNLAATRKCSDRQPRNLLTGLTWHGSRRRDHGCSPSHCVQPAGPRIQPVPDSPAHRLCAQRDVAGPCSCHGPGRQPAFPGLHRVCCAPVHTQPHWRLGPSMCACHAPSALACSLMRGL